MPDDATEVPIWIKFRASSAERARWQELAAARGVSLSELIDSIARDWTYTHGVG